MMLGTGEPAEFTITHPAYAKQGNTFATLDLARYEADRREARAICIELIHDVMEGVTHNFRNFEFGYSYTHKEITFSRPTNTAVKFQLRIGTSDQAFKLRDNKTFTDNYKIYLGIV